jgi:hypothetical protein
MTGAREPGDVKISDGDGGVMPGISHEHGLAVACLKTAVQVLVN